MIAIGKKAFVDKKSLLTGRLDPDLKKRIIKNIIWSIPQYYVQQILRYYH